MKKAAMLSIATVLAFSVMATSQAEEQKVAEDEVATQSSVDNADVAEENKAAPAPEEAVVQDSPQVAKLVAMYPNLISRIAPYGKVCFDGEECDINITVLAPAVEGQARDGESLYKAICSTCHDSGLLGSPKLGDAGAWGARLGKGKATLYNNAINGFNAMPARGGADISDEEVQNAVDYILEKSS